MSIADNMPRIYLKQEPINKAEREQIAQNIDADVAAFLASGGEIIRIPPGMSAETLSLHQDSKGRTRWDSQELRDVWRRGAHVGRN